MLSNDELDDLIADNNFIAGREYQREQIIELLETTYFTLVDSKGRKHIENREIAEDVTLYEIVELIRNANQ